MSDQWGGIYGHANNKKVLERIIESSQIPHAFLFIGKEGVGKDYFALKLAQAVNQKFTPESELPKVLEGLANLNEPYLKYIFALPRGRNETDDSSPYEKLQPEEIDEIKNELSKKVSNPYHHIQITKANTIKISSIRDIKKFLALQFDPTYYRTILISDAHLMNEPSQNALLKSIEEPPDKVIFILTTPYPELLRETIKSRCWSLYFSPLSNEDITQILVEYFKVEIDLAKETAVFADGSVITANRLIEHDFRYLKERTISFLRYALGKKFHLAFKEISEILYGGDSSTLKLFVQMIITWLNDLQRFRAAKSEFFFSDHKETLEKFNKKFPNSEIHDVVFKLDHLSSLIQNNVNPNLIASNLVFTISTLTK